MKHIEIDSEDAVQEAISVFKSNFPVLLLRMPAVFVLLAPPTKLGIQSLHFVKSRLANKNYGTAIGRIDHFYNMVNHESIPDTIKKPSDLELFTGSFVRILITDSRFNSDLVRNGTHQGVLIPTGPYRRLFIALEDAFAHYCESHLFNGHNYFAPLCTSANISGDPLGSITELNRAVEFGVSRNIPLFISSNQVDTEKGSYPIFFLKKDKVTIERNGPGEEKILEKISSIYLQH